MKNYKIRKYSLMWWLLFKPVQFVLFCAFCLAFMSALFYCHDIGLKKIEPVNEVYAETIQVTEVDIKDDESDDLGAYMTDYDTPLTEELEDYVVEVANSYGLPVEIVLGVIEVESNFNVNAVGDYGNSLGLMQIQPRWNKERMERLGVTDLLDAKQNILTGCDILADILSKGYGMEKALVIYNRGEQGAVGYDSTEYSQKVIEKAVNYI